MRRNVGGHADRDAVRAVDQEVGKLARQNKRFTILAVIVVNEIDGVAIEILKHLPGGCGQSGLGVTHGRRWETGNGAKIALRMDQTMAHGPILGHPDQSRIDCHFTMRVVALHRLADDAGTFARAGRRA